MDKSTNQIIHEWLGNCIHKWRQARSTIQESRGIICDKCGEGHLESERFVKPRMPDYSSSLDAVSVAEKKAVEVFGAARYGKAIYRAVCDQVQTTPICNDLTHDYSFIAGFATADSQIRAAAVRQLIEEKK